MEATHRHSLLRIRLLLSSSTRATFLRVDQGTCGARVLIQYADQSEEAVDRDLLLWPILDVIRDDLEGGLRRLLVCNCTTEYREDDGPLGLRAEADQSQTLPSKTKQWTAHLTISGFWVKETTPETICSAAEKAMDDGSLPTRSRAMYNWSRMTG